MDNEVLILPPGEVLEYWFGTGDQKENYKTKWFPANKEAEATVDEEIYYRFNGTFEAALGGLLDGWKRKGVREHVALIVVLDQFSRHIYRYRGLPSDAEDRKIADQEALSQAREFSEKYMDGLEVGDTTGSSPRSAASTSPLPKSALKGEKKDTKDTTITTSQSQAPDLHKEKDKERDKKKGHRRTPNVNATMRRTTEDGDVSVEYTDHSHSPSSSPSSLACLWEIQSFFGSPGKNIDTNQGSNSTNNGSIGPLCGIYGTNGYTDDSAGTWDEYDSSPINGSKVVWEDRNSLSQCSTAEKVGDTLHLTIHLYAFSLGGWGVLGYCVV